MTTEYGTREAVVRQLNDVIAVDDTLPHDYEVVHDRDQAHEVALLEAPYMEEAIGRLALANHELHKGWGMVDESVTMPNRYRSTWFFGLTHALRGTRHMQRTKKAIRAAYDASAHLS